MFQKYSFKDAKIECQPVDVWSTNAIKEFKRYVTESAKLKFIPVNHIDSQYFGRLVITTYEGLDFEVNEILTKIDVAMLCDQNFNKVIQELSTIQIRRYENNSGNISLRDLKRNVLGDIDLKFNQVVNIDEKQVPSKEVTAKIAAWDQRNNEIKMDLHRKVAESVSDDFNFDSVSVCENNDIPFGWTEENMIPNGSNSDDSCTIRKCGTRETRNILRAEYQKAVKKTLQLPSAVPEKCLDSVIGITQRQILLNKRKKIIENSKKMQPKSEQPAVDKLKTPSPQSVSMETTVNSVASTFYKNLRLKIEQQLQKQKNITNVPPSIPKEQSVQRQPVDQVVHNGFVKQELRNDMIQGVRIKNSQRFHEVYNNIPAGFDQSRIRKDLVPTYVLDNSDLSHTEKLNQKLSMQREKLVENKESVNPTKMKTLYIQRDVEDAEHW